MIYFLPPCGKTKSRSKTVYFKCKLLLQSGGHSFLWINNRRRGIPFQGNRPLPLSSGAGVADGAALINTAWRSDLKRVYTPLYPQISEAASSEQKVWLFACLSIP